VDFTRPTAIMMGAELHGVSPDGLDAADEHVALPMLGMVHSLNVSVATALLLYEALRQREAAGLYGLSRLDTERYRATLFEWAYPTLAARCRAGGRPYPDLDRDGQILRSEPD
jgi:tRNA (guanosine-2'-O-)-methyltransferase